MPGYYVENTFEISKCAWAGLDHTDKGRILRFFPHLNDLSFLPLTVTKAGMVLNGSFMHLIPFLLFSEIQHKVHKS